LGVVVSSSKKHHTLKELVRGANGMLEKSVLFCPTRVERCGLEA